MKVLNYITLSLLFFSSMNLKAQKFAVDSVLYFKGKPITLLKDADNDKKVIIYKTSLRLNTDGAPKSYHPKDLRADSLALNLIINGMAVYRKSDSFCISIPDKEISDYHIKYKKTSKRPSDFTKEEKTQMKRISYIVIEEFIKQNYKQPNDYEIFWESVFVNKNDKPCVFSSGENKGYFASMTAVNNGNITDKGECDCNFYLDATKIPAMVLPKGKNALYHFKAEVENLVIAYNPKTKLVAYAIIGDTGPTENLGEGNILMNQNLKGKTTYKTNRQSINNALVISNEVIICVIPNLSTKHLKPYTEEKIRQECEKWIKDAGFDNVQGFVDFMNKTAK
jgi:hypothetical protein